MIAQQRKCREKQSRGNQILQGAWRTDHRQGAPVTGCQYRIKIWTQETNCYHKSQTLKCEMHSMGACVSVPGAPVLWWSSMPSCSALPALTGGPVWPVTRRADCVVWWREPAAPNPPRDTWGQSCPAGPPTTAQSLTCEQEEEKKEKKKKGHFWSFQVKLFYRLFLQENSHYRYTTSVQSPWFLEIGYWYRPWKSCIGRPLIKSQMYWSCSLFKQ